MDDGTPHSAFQDVRFAARFNVLDGPVTITPFVGTSVPSHSYEYFAHAAYGPRVRELEVGAYVGRIVPVGPRRAFVQARYGYGFLDEIVGIERSRSSLDVEVGYFFSPRVRMFAVWDRSEDARWRRYAGRRLAGHAGHLSPNTTTGSGASTSSMWGAACRCRSRGRSRFLDPS